MSDSLQAALEYAARGWAVLPLHSPTADGCSCGREGCGAVGKHPRTRHGVKDATTNKATIRRWWKQWPDSNVGIETGAESGLVVLDVDPEDGGEDSLSALLSTNGELRETVGAITGGGGRHLFFSHPGGQVGNSVGLLGPGLDVRCDGGFVVVPPSRHESGERYRWKPGSEPDAAEVALAPDWLIDGSMRGNGRPEYASEAADRIPEGRRNDTLASFAGSMRRRGMHREAIEAALLVENGMRCDPPLPDDDVQTIARSIARYPPADDPATSHPEATWQFIRVDEFLARQPEEPDWIIEPLLLRGTEMQFYGREGIGKTRATYQQAEALQTGGTWLGFRVCQTGPVLILQLDMAPDELGQVIRDARQAGMPGGEIYVPSTREVLDVLRPDGKDLLKRLNERFRPLVVQVDTINDAFVADAVTNEVARKVIRAFRECFPESGVVYTNHERKKAQYLQAKGGEDQDSYLGPHWQRAARTSLQLKGVNETKAKLVVQKSRSKVGFRELELNRNEYGFFDPVWSPALALQLWPDCLPDPSAAEECDSISAVCRSIGSEFGFNAETVRQAYKRGSDRGVRYRWLKRIKDEGREC